MVFTEPEGFDHDLLLNQLKKTAPKTITIGCTASIIVDLSSIPNHKLALVGLYTDTFGIKTGFSHQINKDGFTAGQKVIEHMLEQSTPGRIKTIFLFPDSATANLTTLLQGVNDKVKGVVPVVGFTASDNQKFTQSVAFFEKQIVTDSALGVGFTKDIESYSATSRGWFPVGRSSRITECEGNIIKSIDGKPPLDFYKDHFGAEEFGNIPAKQLSVCLLYPFGTLSPELNTIEMLRPTKIQGTNIIVDRSVAQQQKIHLMTTSRKSILETTKQAVEDLYKQTQGKNIIGIFSFSSLARMRLCLYQEPTETSLVKEAFGKEIPYIGLYGYSEIYSNKDQNNTVIPDYGSFTITALTQSGKA
jgi:hypothetical protein